MLCCGENKGKYYRRHEDVDLSEFNEYLIPGSENHPKLGEKLLCLHFRYPKVMVSDKPVNHHVEVLREGSIVISRILKDYPKPFRGDVLFFFYEGNRRSDIRHSVSIFWSRTAAKVKVDGELKMMRVDAYEELVADFLKSDNVSELLLYEATIGLMRDNPYVTYCGGKKTIFPDVAAADESVTLVSEGGLGWTRSCWACGEFMSNRLGGTVCECRNAAFCDEVCKEKAKLTHVCKPRASRLVTKLWDKDPPRCRKCQKEGSDRAPLKRCGGCKKVTYCGPECARHDWKDHKEKCSYARKT